MRNIYIFTDFRNENINISIDSFFHTFMSSNNFDMCWDITYTTEIFLISKYEFYFQERKRINFAIFQIWRMKNIIQYQLYNMNYTLFNTRNIFDLIEFAKYHQKHV